MNFISCWFLVDDIQTTCGQRHLVFVTVEQVDVLSKAKKWYTDGTFKIIRRPFHKLLSIHTLLWNDGNKTSTAGIRLNVQSPHKGLQGGVNVMAFL